MLRWSSLNFASGSPGVGNFSTSRNRIPSPNHHDSSSFPSSPRSCIINKPLPSSFFCSRPSSKTSSGTAKHLQTTQPADFSQRPQRGFPRREDRTPEISQRATGREIPCVPRGGGVDGRTCQFLITGLEQTTSQPSHTGVSPRKRAFCSPPPAN